MCSGFGGLGMFGCRLVGKWLECGEWTEGFVWSAQEVVRLLLLFVVVVVGDLLLSLQ